MAGRRISGIFVPITLDTSNVERDLERLAAPLGRITDSIQRQFAGAIQTVPLVRSIVNVTRAMGELRDSTQALAQNNSMDMFRRRVEGVNPALHELARTFGTTVAQQRAVMRELVDVQQVERQVASLRQIQRAFGNITAEATLARAAARGVTIDPRAAERFNPDTVRNQFRAMAEAANVRPTTQGLQLFRDRAALNSTNAFIAATGLSTRELIRQSEALGLTRAQIDRYAASQRAASRGMLGVLTPASLSGGLQSGAAAVGVSFGAYGVAELGKSAYQASMKMENLDLAFQSVFGSAAKAQTQLNFVRKISDELGLSFLDTAEGAKKLFAAAKGTVLEESAQSILKSFSTMGAALKLSGPEMESVFLAIAQMISKGKVSAEELRLQLSERMPGAVTLFAKSMNVTTAELDKMLQAGKVGLDSLKNFSKMVGETYAMGAASASKGLQAELNRMGTAWFDFKRAFVDTKGSADVVRDLTDALKNLTAMTPAIVNISGMFIKLGINAALVFGVFKGATALTAAAAGFQALSASAGLWATASAMVIARTTAMTAAFTAFIATPAGAIAAIAALSLGVYHFATQQTEGEKVLSRYNVKLSDLTKAASGAADSIASLNAANLIDLTKNLGTNLKLAQREFASLGSQEVDVDYTASYGQVPTPLGGFESGLESLRGFFDSKAKSKLISDAKVLGDSFSAEFSDAVAKGSDPAPIISKFSSAMTDIRAKMTDAKVDPSTIESFDKLTGAYVSAATKVDVLTASLREAKQAQDRLGTLGIAVDMSKVKEAYESIQKLASGTQLGKEIKIEADMSSAVESLAVLKKAADATAPAIGQTDAATGKLSAVALDAASSQDKFSTSMMLVAQEAIKGSANLDMIDRLIEKVGATSLLTAEQIKTIKAAMRDAFSQEAADAVNNLLAGMDLRVAMAGATKGTVEAFGQIKSLVKDNTDKMSLFNAIATKSVSALHGMLKDPSITSEQLTEVLNKAHQTAAALDTIKGAPKAEAAFKKINDTIDNSKRKIEEWQAKLSESKGESFVVQLEKEIGKLDKAISASKGNATLISQLQQLKVELKAVGDLRAAQIDKEQMEQLTDKYATYYRKLSSSYGKTTGSEGAEVIKAARQTADIQLRELEMFHEKGLVAEEEYQAQKAMIQAVYRDVERRNTEDLYNNLSVAFDDYSKKYGNFTKGMGGVITNAMDASATAIANFAISGARDFKSLADAFASMAQDMLSMAAKLFAQQMIGGLMQSVMGMFGGSSGLPFGKPGSSGNTVNVSYPTKPFAMGGIPWEQMSFAAGGVPWEQMRFASGGVPLEHMSFAKGAALPSIGAFSNSIVDRTTKFAMGSNRMGEMGEHGPEAIVPLVRAPSGHYGVRSVGGSSSGDGVVIQQSFNVQIENNSSASVKAEKEQDDQGNVNLKVMIEELVGDSMRRPGSPTSRALSGTYNAKHVMASR